MVMLEGEGDEQRAPAKLRIPSVKSVLSVLHAIRNRASGKHQLCTLLLGSDGLFVRWEDDAKALQSSVHLNPNVFSDFRCQDPRRLVGVSLPALMDTMAVFSSSTAELEMTYPGPHNEVLMEMVEKTLEGVEIGSYASVSSQETPVLRDLADYWEEPASWFLGQGQLFKEVIDDLEWAGGNIVLELRRDPPSIRFSSIGAASGNGNIEVEIPVSDLPGFHCSGPSVSHTYPLKRLQMALTNLPVSKDPSAISTKVTLDSRGLMKVNHMVNMFGVADSTTQHQGPNFTQQAGGAVGGQIGRVQFILLPSDTGLEDE